MIAFGPVPSRRFGSSLGINNIPPKICTYGCVYCQIGETIVKSVERRHYYGKDRVVGEVYEKLRVLEKEGIKSDYLTFVPDGEPTLDIDLGKEAEDLKETGIKTAIISNSSLLWMEDVREDLYKFDAVSLKVDAVSESLWKKMDRPHEKLKIHRILDGIRDFSSEYSGKMMTETMLVSGIDYGKEAEKIADFLREISPEISYISVPTRPPAESWVKAPEEDVINSVFQKFTDALGKRVELLISYEGNDFKTSGDPQSDILAIVSVHPMREEALHEFLRRSGRDWNLVEKLLKEEKIISVEYMGHRYFIRKMASRE